MFTEEPQEERTNDTQGFMVFPTFEMKKKIQRHAIH